jgi:hypothetical protein
MKKLVTALALGASAFIFASCQSSGGGADGTLSSATTPAPAADAPAVQTAAATAEAAKGAAGNEALAYAQTQAASPAQCAIQIAAGPPPKPARGADFGSALAKDTGKAVGRGAMQIVGGMLGGGLGSAAAGGLAKSTIRNEEDIKGVWTITDGRQDCGCQIGKDGFFALEGKGGDTGTAKLKGCGDQRLAQVASWALGYSFAGYDAKFELKTKDKKTVIATLNREGIHYFSGTMSDGTPVVMWREGQTYSQLATFK